MKKKLYVMIPTLNEEEGIGSVIDNIPKKLIKDLGFNLEVIVVDGHSTDNTVKIAKKKGAKVILQQGKGKGNAVKQVFRMLKLGPKDLLVMIDGDDTYNPQEIPLLLTPLIEDKADVVMGARLDKLEKGSITKLNLIGNKLFTNLARILYRANVDDLCTGFWAFNQKAFNSINITATGFDLEVDLFIKTIQKNLRLKSVAIHYSPRKGRTKLNPFSHGLVILLNLVRNVRDWNPLVISGLLTLFFYGLGALIGYEVFLNYLTLGTLTTPGRAMLSSLFLIMGTIFLGFGLILDYLKKLDR